MSEAASGTQAARWLRRNMNWIAVCFALLFFVVPRVSPYEPLNEYLSVFHRLAEWMLKKVETLFADYGYYVVFLGVLAENSMFLGLFVPGVVILILAGLAAENGSINPWLVVGLGVAATLIGDTLSYLIGRFVWSRAVRPGGGMSQRMQGVRDTLESNRTWIILAYHFAGYSRMLGPAAAGLFRLPYHRWAPLDYAGAAIWVVAFTALGYVLGLFGVEFGDTKQTVRLLEWLFLGILVAALAITFMRAARQRSSAEQVTRGAGAGRAAPVVVRVEDAE